MDVIYPTRTLLEADLAHDPDTIGFVYADPAEENNDLYVKVGASGTGSWTLTSALHEAVNSILAPQAGFNVELGGAGNSTMTGTDNTLVGVSAGESLTTGSRNTDYGRAAGRANQTGNENVCFGTSAAIFVTGGSQSVRVGFSAQGNSTAVTSRVTAVGAISLQNCAADDATGIGWGAGVNLTTGTKFTSVGSAAGSRHTTQASITMIGSGAGQSASQSLVHNNQTAIGADAYCDWENQVALGNDSVEELRLFGDSWVRQYAFADTVIGKGAGNRSSLGGGRVIIGYNAGQGMNTADDESNVVIGYVAGNSAQKFRYSVGIGDRAIQYAYNCIDCTVVGSQAGRNLGRLVPAEYESDDEAHIKAAGNDVTHGGSLPVPGLVGASFFGKNAGRYNTIGLNNTGFGDSALGFTTVGEANVAVGYVCGEGNVVGSRNAFVGQGIRLRIYSGDDNVAIGYGIGSNLGSHGDWRPGGDRNSNVGSAAAYIWGGSDTASLGFHTLYNLSMGTGGDVAIGSRAGEALVTGGQNIFIGQDAGQGVGQATDVQNSIAIGAGAQTVRPNQTVLGNDATEETVIRGNVFRNNVATVSQLPSATDAGIGARAFVSDAASTTFYDTLTGGGATAAPVFSDGTTWRIG